jgi:hypothetical protein
MARESIELRVAKAYHYVTAVRWYDGGPSKLRIAERWRTESSGWRSLRKDDAVRLLISLDLLGLKVVPK